MIKDYFLKFNSKSEALQVFSTISGHTYTPYNANNHPLPLEIVQQTETFAIDEVGIIINNSNQTTKTGYHYNYRMILKNQPETPIPSELINFIVSPKSPHKEFF